MSELKAHEFCESDEFFREYPGPLSNEMRQYYLKSEADKVISYHKYKRCKKMAMFCELEIDQWIEYSDRWQRRKKWLNLWLELAEKFKSIIDYEN